MCDEELPRFLTSQYGYWINCGGAILSVSLQNGHIPFLMESCDFTDLSPTQNYHLWYEAAFLRGWIRVAAPADSQQCFRFQFKKLTPEARISLLNLICGLPPHEQYIFESAEPIIFKSPNEAIQFIIAFCDNSPAMSTVTWLSNP